MVDLAVDYGSLQYIELRGDDSKLPAKKWGGYSQDYDAADHVHTHDEIMEMDGDEWGIVGGEDNDHTSQALLIFDVDSYKAPDDFDVETRLTVPDNTLITRSQSGGNHVYFRVHCERGELSETDFDVSDDLPFDIDIRGSVVSHHVVAPADIPGVDGSYEIVNDEPISSEFGPGEACSKIKLDGEPAIEFDPGTRSDIDYDRPDEAPQDMPTCYHAGLSLRRTAPDDGSVNTHKVNVVTALCGLAAGYEVDEVVSHMCGEYAPMDGETDVSDKEITEYQVTHLQDKLDAGYSPPALATLRNNGIFGDNQECGVDCPIDIHHTRSKPEWAALKTVEEFIKEFDPVDDRPEKPDLNDDNINPDDPDVQDALEAWPDDDDKDDVADAVTTLTERDYDEHVSELADRVYPDCEKMDCHRALAHQLQDVKGNIITYEGKLVIVNTGRWFNIKKTLFNFELEVTSRLSVEGEGRMANIEVRPAEPTESKFELQIEPRVFNDSRRFKDEVLAKRFSTTIETAMHDSDVMDVVRKYISRQDVPDLVGQKSMGLSRSGDEFVTPNGVINENGWADEPRTVYVEQDSGAERSFEVTPEENDADEVNNEGVAEIIELFTRTRDLERFIPLLGWLYAAPHRERIVDTSGEMNLMFIDGESGVGKSGTMKAANRLFGMQEDPFSASDTVFAHIKTFSSSSGVPVWIDEYKTSEMAEWQQNNFHELLRKAATGGIEQRGNADQSTTEYVLQAPVVVSGETSLRGSAENRRAVNVTFTNQPTVSGTDEYRRFKNLMGDAVEDEDGNVTFPDSDYPLGNHAVRYYSYVAAMSRDEFEDEWFSAREYVSRRVSEWDVELDDMEVQGLQTVAFGFEQLRSFSEEVGADLAKLPDRDDLDNALRYIADVEGDGRETHTDQFLGLVQRAAVSDYVEKGEHYDVVRAGKPGEELRVNVTRTFDAVSKYVRDHDLNEDLLGSARDYKSRYEEAKDQDTYVACTSQGTPGVGRAVGIDTDRAAEELAEFDRTVFTGGVDSDDDEAVNGDSDDDGPTPISGLDPDANDTGFATITARVTKWSDGPDGSKLVQSGTVKDSSGAIRVVAFEPFDARTTSHGPVDEGDYVRLKDVVVDSFDENTQLIIEDGTTEIESIQPGVGTSKPVASPDQQETVNDANSDDGSGEDSTVGAGSRETDQGAVRVDGGAAAFTVSDIAEAAVSRVVGQYPDDETVTRKAVWDCFRATTDGGGA